MNLPRVAQAARLQWWRRTVQGVTALAANANLAGFWTGRIYQGASKSICVPFLNCYSCPGALGACPVGTVQAFAVNRSLPVFALGTVVVSGGVAGRAICGWLCPFGLLQELAHRGRRALGPLPPLLTKLKYAVMLAMLPAAAWLVGAGGFGTTYFCAYICPAGTLEAGIPLLLTNPSLRSLAGAVFTWKLAILAVLVWATVVYYRPFCRTLCPLGAFYGLFNRAAVLRLRFSETLCLSCGSCGAACPVGINLPAGRNSSECVRCLRCVQACPSGALRFGTTATLGQAALADLAQEAKHD
jgi:ferredoxin-type protein NapH